MFSSAQIEAAATVASVILSAATIWVLVRTKQAAEAQARSANKLTEATERQIATSEEQAQAAKEQVEIVRRQITESLRPILVARRLNSYESSNKESLIEFSIKNEGEGVALDAWWTYGKPNLQPYGAHAHARLGPGILAPGMECSVRVKDAQAFTQGLLIVYRSLAGVLLATEIEAENQASANIYHPDAEKDFKGLSELSFPESPAQPI